MTAPPEPPSGPTTVPPESAGERLDRFLAAWLQLPRNQIRRWILDGRVEVGGVPVVRPSSPLAEGSIVAWSPPPPPDPRVEPEEGPLDVLFEDEHLVVVNKPAGLVVHPGAGNPAGTLVHRLLARYPEMAEVGGPGRPGIVHRIDQGTSGVLVAARSPAAYRGLSAAFAERRVKKLYLAVVFGVPRERRGTIEAPIGRHPQRRKEMTVRASGRPASTRYRRLDDGGGLSLLEIDLGTGRTHQIRVHLKSIGHPLVGDPTYGESRWRALPRVRQRRPRDFPRPALHARRLVFDHPVAGGTVDCTAPVPEDLVELWEKASGRPWPEVPPTS